MGHKNDDFNSITVANDYTFGTQWPNGLGHHFSLPTHLTVEGICLALAGKFLQLGVVNSFCI